MGIAFDSGWVPVASGSVNANVGLGGCTAVQLIIAASGAAGVASAQAGWAEGAATPIPWNKWTPAYPTTPLITGSYTVAAPAASTSSIYYIGIGTTGSLGQLSTWVPDVLNVTATAGAASWARVIINTK